MIFFFFFFSLFRSFFAYNETVSQHCVYLAQLNYCGQFDVCDSCVIHFVVENSGSMALQGFDFFTSSIFTSFRGSANTRNWIEDFQISPIAPYNDSDILVEKGFYKNYMFIKSMLFENLQNLSLVYNTNSLLITGHSLGSSAATLFAFDIALQDFYAIDFFYNFGSPRVGNENFVHVFNSLIYGFRVVHNNDIVTNLPPSSFGYEHISQGVWYDLNNTFYIFIDDYSCYKDCSTSDHLNYLNISMGSSGCPLSYTPSEAGG